MNFVRNRSDLAQPEAGVRGVRFNFVKRLVDFTPKEKLADIVLVRAFLRFR